MRWRALVIKLRDVALHVKVVVNFECLTFSAHNKVIRTIWVHFNLCIEENSDKEAILITIVSIKLVLFDILDHNCLCFTFIINKLNWSQRSMIHSEHITLLPRT